MWDRQLDLRKDRTRCCHVIENDIRLLAAEIYRLIKLPYASASKRKQILYLEEVMAAYERDLKKHE